MPDIFDTSTVPDDPQYWESLARRVSSSARRPRSGLDWVAAGGARWIAAASVVTAAAVGLSLLLTGGANGKRAVDEWADALAPRDEIGWSLDIRDSPPPIGVLMLFAPGSGDRGGARASSPRRQ